jgi:squalene synthase HpnC
LRHKSTADVALNAETQALVPAIPIRTSQSAVWRTLSAAAILNSFQNKDEWKCSLNVQTVAALQPTTGATPLAQPRSYNTAEAFAYCERMAREHYENFPVGSLLVPRARRKHVYSIYAFARTADDFADEGYDVGQTLVCPIWADGPGCFTAADCAGDGNDVGQTKGCPTEADRLRSLDEWEAQLAACYRGEASHPVFVALTATVRELQLPEQLFRDLLSAFKQDVVKRRYADFAEVLDYCRRSANPVGRLILRLFDYRDAHLDELSDAICTALQLANFWQDVAADIQKDRVYLPQDEMRQYGVTFEDLQARQGSAAFCRLLQFQVERTRDLFQHGRALPDLVNGRLALELRLTWHGGMRILELIERQAYDTLPARPKLTGFDKVVLLSRALFNR